jgi:nicotinate-nucleotide pyrophosphorylase (carboxylating)
MRYVLKEEDHSIIRRALEEDIGEGDITTKSCISINLSASCNIVAKEEGVLAGLDLAFACFLQSDSGIRFKREREEGERLNKCDLIAVISGPIGAILTAERTALNFLQRLSGIATLTRKFVDAVAGTGVKIYDTRKTTPTFRRMEKYAVRVGGGHNHRFGLFDRILIKENHIKMAGGVSEAIRRVRKVYPKRFVEVETKSMDEVREALDWDINRIMLDNFKLSDMERAVGLIKKSRRRIEIEVSGNITLCNVKDVALLGPHIISVGAITHSPKSLDISLEA